MGPLIRDRVLARLDDPAVAAHDPETVSALRSALASRPDAAGLVSVGPHGTVTCWAEGVPGATPRRLVELDRHGRLLTVARWDASGALRLAKLRLPDGRWVGIEPRSADSPLWGASDRLWLLDASGAFVPAEELTHFQSVDYGAIGAIPPLADPRRLPPGAGTAVLNFLACLLQDQGTARVFYRGPYATEQLFTALLESFRYDPDASSPLARFLDSDLPWTPAPHERRFLADGTYVQLRAGVEKVVFRGNAYYRRPWQALVRSEPRVVRDEAGTVVCSLWALGTAVEDHLMLTADGGLARVVPIDPESGPSEPLGRAWRTALGALVAHQSAPALRPWLHEPLEALRLEWGPVTGDLLGLDGDRAVVSLNLSRLFRRRLAECGTRSERLSVALALISEVARLLGPTLRLTAQGALLSLPEAAQRAALEQSPPAPSLSAVEDLAQSLADGAGCPRD
ncbi:MAG: hypothetical protein HY726_09700 [Candidatus Rokubacteria bacterium]|nr:hypothetical protein [Candidatus Rokubacteria bacterium]